MKLTAYPRYKSSGVEWLGNVPEHWEVKKLGWHIDLFTGFAFQSERFSLDDGIRLVRGDNVTEGELRWGDKTRYWTEESPSLDKFSLRAGDIVIGMDGSKVGKNYAMVRESDLPLLLVQRVARLRCDEAIHQRFLFALIGSEQFRTWVELTKTEPAIPHISPHDIRAFPVPFPSEAEQRAIAAYLDRETGRVDRLVAKKQDLIERLKEKRTALISRTVTRGLPPAAARAANLPENPPLKPSGVPWFDECPSHWQTKRLRHISDIIVVGVVVNPSSYVTDEGVVFLLGGDVREMQIDTSDCKRCSPESSNGPLVKSRLDGGDLVVVRVGYPGVAAVIPPELEGGNVASMMLVRKHQRFCSQWLAYAFNSQVGRDQVEIVQYGAAQKQFNISHAVDFAFPFPPLPEQVAIAAYLDEETAKLDALVGKVEEAVERLQEYRTALITAAVTGKINVINL